MPYYMEESEGQFCVFKEGQAIPLECYDDQEDADDYLTALNIATADEETKAESDTHIPPEAVAQNAQMALDVRAEKPPSEQGMTLVGLARANQLAKRDPVSVATLRRMLSYFERHEVDKQGSTWDEQGKGWQAWMGWGGDEGWDWAKEIIAEEDAMTTKASRRHSEADMKLIRMARKQIAQAIDILKELGDDGLDEEIKKISLMLTVDVSDDDHAEASDEVPDDAQMEEGVADIVDALDSMRTMKLEEGKLDTIKSLPQSVKAIGDYMVKGKGIVYGGFDLTKDRFTPDTDLGGSRPFEGMPVFYDHALGGIKSQIGMVKAWTPTDEGIDVEIELDRRHKYADHVMKLVEAGALGLSTGAVTHLVERQPVKGGYEIKRWHVAEISLTPEPAEPRTATEVKSTEGDTSSTADETPTPDDTETTQSTQETKSMSNIGDHNQDGITAKTAPAIHARPDEVKKLERVKAWDAYFRRGVKSAVLEEPQERTNASGMKALLPNATPGSYLLEPEWETQIITKRNQDSILGMFPITRRTVGTNKYDMNSESTRVTLAPLTAGNPFPDVTPGITRRQIEIYDMAMSVKVNNNVLNDTAFDLLGFMNEIIAGAYIDAVNKYLLVGTGSSQPYGILTRAATVSLAGASAITVQEVKDIYYTIKPQYRRPGEVGWGMNTDTLSTIRSLTVANQFAYDETPGGRQDETMETLLRRPVFESPDMANLGTGNKPLFFGNWRYLVFAENAGISVRRDESNRADYNETVFFVTTRFGSDVSQDEAFAVGVNA